MNILFVCSRNKWRSRTAETIFKNEQQHHVKSAGTDDGARIRLTEALLKWAEIIFVMEDKHRQKIIEKFKRELYNDKMVVLGIADDYQYMDEELIEIFRTSILPYLDTTP